MTWDVVTLRLGVRCLGSRFPRLLGLGEGHFGHVGSLKGGSVARVTADRQEALPLVTSPVRRRDNGALFWGLWDRETPPPSETLFCHPSFQWARAECVVEDDGGRYLLHTATAPQIYHSENRVEGNHPASSRSSAAPFFCILSHTLSARLPCSTSTSPDAYPTYLWPPHQLGLQSVLQPGPPPPALRLASGL